MDFMRNLLKKIYGWMAAGWPAILAGALLASFAAIALRLSFCMVVVIAAAFSWDFFHRYFKDEGRVEEALRVCVGGVPVQLFVSLAMWWGLW